MGAWQLGVAVPCSRWVVPMKIAGFSGYCDECGTVGAFDDGYCYECKQTLPYCVTDCGNHVTMDGELLCNDCRERVTSWNKRRMDNGI